MAMADFNHGIEAGEVKAVKNGDSFSVLVDGKIACSMSSGGAYRFRNELQAEVFGRHYVRGYTGGSFLSADVDNYIVDNFIP